MNTDSVLLICMTILAVLTTGDPDLLDALIHFFMEQ